MIQKLDLFPITVFKTSCTDWEEKKQKLLSLVDWDNPDYINEDQVSDFNHNLENGCSYKDQFVDIIAKELYEILFFCNYSNIDIINLWAQRYKNSQYMPVHDHGALGYSCVLYTEFDREVHYPTRFVSSMKNESGSSSYYEPDTHEGDLIVFPSFLLHDVKPNRSNKNRTIFSFNCRLF